MKHYISALILLLVGLVSTPTTVQAQLPNDEDGDELVVGGIYVIRGILGYYGTSSATSVRPGQTNYDYDNFLNETDLVLYEEDGSIKAKKRSSLPEDLSELTASYYWVLNEGTNGYYFTNCDGTGVIGRTKGWAYSANSTDVEYNWVYNIPGFSSSVSDALYFSDMDDVVRGSTSSDSGSSCNINTTGGGTIGYGLQYYHYDSDGTQTTTSKYLSVGCNMSNTDGDDLETEFNFWNVTTSNNTQQLYTYFNNNSSGYVVDDDGVTTYIDRTEWRWSNAFRFEKADYTHNVTLYRSTDAYMASSRANETDSKDFYATLYLTFDSRIVNDVEVYTIAENSVLAEGGTVPLTKLELNTGVDGEDGLTYQYIPKYTPVLLRLTYDKNNESHVNNDTQSYYLARLGASQNVASVSVNENFKGVNINTYFDLSEYDWENELGKAIYGLGRKNGRVAMYRRVGSASGERAYVKAYTAYYDQTSSTDDAASANALTFVFLDSETSGIQAVNTENIVTDNAIYDLQGRRVQKPSSGIYIQNGKKYLVK